MVKICYVMLCFKCALISIVILYVNLNKYRLILIIFMLLMLSIQILVPWAKKKEEKTEKHYNREGCDTVGNVRTTI